MGSSLSAADVLARSQAAIAVVWPAEIVVEATVTDVSPSSGRHLFCRVGPERLPVVIQPRCAAGLLRRVGARSDLVGVRLALRGQVELFQGHELQLIVSAVKVIAATFEVADSSRVTEARLTAEGIFDLQHKLTLPPAPLRLVIVGPTGNGVDDVAAVLHGSPWAIALHTIPAPSSDPDALVSALRSAGEGTDLVLLVRGGGDLAGAAYDDEPVVRAVATCPVPVLCGIGHTADRTLCDRAAALSLATPTAAARWVVDRLAELDAALVTASTRARAAAGRRGVALDTTKADVELGGDLVPELRHIVELVAVAENPNTAPEQAASAVDDLTGRVDAIRSRLRGGKP
jgi:exodeoxyribonuclease VII large subunit